MALTKTSYSMLEGACFNIKDFGAVENTDITSILNTVLSGSSGILSKGDTLIIDGQYFISGTVNVSVSGVNIIGHTRGQPAVNNNPDEFNTKGIICKFNGTPDTTYMFDVADGCRNVTFFGVYLNGGATYGYSGVSGIRFGDTASNGNVHYCSIAKFRGHGLKMSQAGYVTNTEFGGVKGLNGIYGIIAAADIFISDVFVQFFEYGLFNDAPHTTVCNSFFDVCKVGMYLGNCVHGKFANIKTGYNAKVGIQLGDAGKNVRTTTFSSINTYLTGSSAYGSGSAGDFNWTNDGIGLLIKSARSVTFSSVISGADIADSGQAYGLVVNGSGERIVFGDCIFYKNDTQDVTLAGHTLGDMYLSNVFVITSDIPELRWLNYSVVSAGALSSIGFAPRVSEPVIQNGTQLNGTSAFYYCTSNSSVTAGDPIEGRTDGHQSVVVNVGSYNITFPASAILSTKSGSNIVLAPNKGFTMVWSASANTYIEI